jgi:hypothetical protein
MWLAVRFLNMLCAVFTFFEYQLFCFRQFHFFKCSAEILFTVSISFSTFAQASNHLPDANQVVKTYVALVSSSSRFANNQMGCFTSAINAPAKSPSIPIFTDCGINPLANSPFFECPK